MHLIYLADFFEDNYNIVRDRFETELANVIKYMYVACCKETKEIPIY